jgi:hypothetical protein
MSHPGRRRTERLLLTFPIRVEGSDPKGQSFQEDTRTLVVNRHGARISLKRPVGTGQALRITNLMGNRVGDFRVVGPTQPPTDQGGEWGVECRDETRNIWGVDFPPLDEDGSGCSAVLECRRCRKIGLTPMSLVALDVLSSAGLLTRECSNCGQATSWGYSETQLGMPAPGRETELAIREVMEGPPPTNERRASPRVPLRLPIRVRNWYGTEEFAKSENVSKGGLAFITDKRYEVGEAIMVSCPYKPGVDNIELRARVVRRAEVKGSGRFVYGVCYQKES